MHHVDKRILHGVTLTLLSYELTTNVMINVIDVVSFNKVTSERYVDLTKHDAKARRQLPFVAHESLFMS